MARRRTPERTSLISVTGQEIAADLLFAHRVTIGSLDFTELPMIFADAPPFERLNLSEKPALLLGMAQLRAFQRVAIDFQERKILFDLPPNSETTGSHRDR